MLAWLLLQLWFNPQVPVTAVASASVHGRSETTRAAVATMHNTTASIDASKPMEGCCLPRSRPATRTACPYRTTAHPPAAPLQHARYAPTCPMRHVYYRHVPQLRSGVSLCLWCFRAGPRSRQRTRQRPPLMHMHELAEWGCCWVLLWWEFVALSCRGERYVYDLGPRLAVGPFGRFAGASEAPLCGTSHGPRRKKKKKGG